MGFLELLNHVINLLAPAAVVAALTSGVAKLLWRNELKAQPWLRLFGTSAVAGGAVLLVGLGLTAHDGRMSTYALLALVVAVTVWWMGFGPGRQR